MKKSVALGTVLICAGGLVLLGKIILTPHPSVGAAPIAEVSQGGQSESSAVKDSSSESSAVKDTSSAKDSKTESKQSAKKDTPKDEVKDEGFRFPNDRGGPLLSQLLSPSAPAAELSSKAPTAGPAAVERPSLSSTALVIAVPRLPLDPHRHNLLLGQIPEETPFSYYQNDPRQPRDQSLPTGDRVRVASVDTNLPMALPILAKPVSDRVSLEDPTLDLSVEAAVTAKMPARVTPAPYVRISIPNPFEFREAVQVKITVDEDPLPITGTPRPPK
jgi:hypothetical protein